MVTNREQIESWNQRDTLASNYIYATVTEKMRDYLINCETSCEMWLRLATKFTQRSAANKGQLWTQFYEYKFVLESDILANITAIENLARQLKDLEENITEIQITNKIVSVLPQHYGHFKLCWDNLDEEQQTTDLLTTRLLSEERRIGKPSTEKQDTSNLTETAFSSTHSNQKLKRGSLRYQTLNPSQFFSNYNFFFEILTMSGACFKIAIEVGKIRPISTAIFIIVQLIRLKIAEPIPEIRRNKGSMTTLR